MKRTIALVLLLAGSAHAQEPAKSDTLPYRVKQNDSLAIIASEYYGDRSKTAFITAENKLTKPVRQGEKLRVPIMREVTTSPGDTFQALAAALLGDPLRGAFLAEINGMAPDDNLAAGTPILVPFTVQHTADKTESLKELASTYYGDGKFADVLKRYNNLDKPALEKGETITIPSFNVKMHPAKIPVPDAESKLRRERRRDNSRLAASAIPIARHAWRIGDFATVRKTLDGIDTAFIELAPAIEIGILLGSAYVAFDSEKDALDTFKRVIDRRPSQKLRKVDHSPKVLAIWKKADGAVE
ncbi:MAG: LysM peptidoglycan-binding domain-containing protein [Kofleriaceae bacterium]